MNVKEHTVGSILPQALSLPWGQDHGGNGSGFMTQMPGRVRRTGKPGLPLSHTYSFFLTLTHIYTLFLTLPSKEVSCLSHPEQIGASVLSSVSQAWSHSSPGGTVLCSTPRPQASGDYAVPHSDREMEPWNDSWGQMSKLCSQNRAQRSGRPSLKASLFILSPSAYFPRCHLFRPRAPPRISL